ncbi:MAG: glycosyltransferase [Cellulosilyticaceae bacterium]
MNKVVLFMATNGVGLGHITRLLAVAKRYKTLEPDSQIIFFSTSLAIEVVLKEGYIYYYFPSKSTLPKNVTNQMWNDMLYGYLGSVLAIYHPQMLIFDGAYPYDSMTILFRLYPQMKTVWIRRMGRMNEVLENKTPKFNHLVRVQDIIEKTMDDEKYYYVPPIMFVDEEDAVDKAMVRSRLGISSDAKVIYIQLGTGSINNITPILNRIIEIVLENTDYEIVLGESIIGMPLAIKVQDRMHIIRHYPNAIYFKGMDFAITAAGYNTCHEMLYFKIPTIFIPNLKTQYDEQNRRAQKISELESGICIGNYDDRAMLEGLKKLEKNQEMLKANIQKVSFNNGALVCAMYLKTLL